jgi:hypothetical protein
MDSGASIHISPDKGDFITLHPTPSHSVKGIGGTSITAFGVGDIKLRIARGASIVLHNALYIPHSTVRLISVGLLADDSNTVTHFDKLGCWITDKSTGAFIARGDTL